MQVHNPSHSGGLEDVRFKGAGLQSEFKGSLERIRETLSQGKELKRWLWV